MYISYSFYPLSAADDNFSAGDDPRGFSVEREHGGVYRHLAEIWGIGKVERIHSSVIRRSTSINIHAG